MIDGTSIPDRYWSLPADRLLLELRSTPEGLSSEEAGRRLTAVILSCPVARSHHSLSEEHWDPSTSSG
jgi:hypothetical protein